MIISVHAKSMITVCVIRGYIPVISVSSLYPVLGYVSSLYPVLGSCIFPISCPGVLYPPCILSCSLASSLYPVLGSCILHVSYHGVLYPLCILSCSPVSSLYPVLGSVSSLYPVLGPVSSPYPVLVSCILHVSCPGVLMLPVSCPGVLYPPCILFWGHVFSLYHVLGSCILPRLHLWHNCLSIWAAILIIRSIII